MHSKLRSFINYSKVKQETKKADQQMGTTFPLDYPVQVHEVETLRYFNAEPGRQLFNAPHTPLNTKRNLVICFINRSGSNWLGECLYATGLSGLGDEYLNEGRIKMVCDEQGFKSLNEYLHYLPATQIQEGGTLATKLSWDQLYFLTKHQVIPEMMPNTDYIYLVRRDLAAQALSLLVAEQTGQWKSNWNSGINKQPSPDDIADEDIIRTIDRLSRYHQYFLRYFGTFGIKPYMMFYEDFVDNTQEEMDKLLVHLNLAESGKWAFDETKLEMRKQATNKSAARLEKFRKTMYNACKQG